MLLDLIAQGVVLAIQYPEAAAAAAYATTCGLLAAILAF